MGPLVRASCCCTYFTYIDAFKSLKNKVSCIIIPTYNEEFKAKRSDEMSPRSYN